MPSWFSDTNFLLAAPMGPVTYSPALNRMVLGAAGTLQVLDADGHVTPLLTLPQFARVSALAGVGREILAVVVLYAPTYHFELWRIAAMDGTVTEQIGLPLTPPPLSVHDITSIDLAADGCTLAYTAPGEVIHRYDICARRPLEDVATRQAAAVHFLPQGNLLVVEARFSGTPPASISSPPSFQLLARYDRDGRLVSTADPALDPSEWIAGIALDPDGSTAWIVTSYSFSFCVVAGRVMAVNASNGALIAGPWPFGGRGIAVAGEWRAAEQPARGRAVRH